MDIPRLPSRTARLRPYLIGAGVLVLAVASIALARVGPAEPSIAADRLVVDEVVRADLIRTVSGPGRLLPEDQHLISAPVSGRVDQRLVEAGARVDSGDTLLVFSNPEVDLRLLEAQRVLAEARTARQRLVSANRIAKLTAQRDQTGLEARLHEARDQHRAISALADEGLVSSIEASRASSHWQELSEQARLAEQQLAVMESTFRSDLEGQDEEIHRVAQVAAFHRLRVASLTVRSPISGVVHELSVEPGQWVPSGELLARVFRPGQLKAEVRIPEARAGEVTPGQQSSVVIRGDSIDGVVRRVSPAAVGGAVAVEVELTTELPASARPDLNIEGRIETGRVPDTLQLRRPAGATPGQRRWMYRLDGKGRARRVPLVLGEASSERIQVVEGARAGDRFIVNDLEEFGGARRIRILD